MTPGARGALLLLPLAALAAACQQPATAAERALRAPDPVIEANETSRSSIAIFAGGCFWGVEGVFSHVPGVTSAVSGYHGGGKATATYDRVGMGDTGHAEAVRVVYDPAKVRYDQLLQIFFSVVADPTTLNYQGPDHGTQYRSALVPLNLEQRRAAAGYLAQLGKSGVWTDPIVTRIEPYKGFHRAEAYHQDFMAANPRHPYNVRWDAPKVTALAKLCPEHFKRGFTPN